MIISFQTQGKFGITKAIVPSLALGLITSELFILTRTNQIDLDLDVLQGKIELNDAKQILMNMLQIWTESNVWYEFLEQLVYILVAVTVPSFAQGAIGKLMGKISLSN
jgi:hypothetical protein